MPPGAQFQSSTGGGGSIGVAESYSNGMVTLIMLREVCRSTQVVQGFMQDVGCRDGSGQVPVVQAKRRSPDRHTALPATLYDTVGQMVYSVGGHWRVTDTTCLVPEVPQAIGCAESPL